MSPCVIAVRPLWAIENGRITIEGSDFLIDQQRLPEVRIGGARARVVYASATCLACLLPAGLEGGPTKVSVDGSDGAQIEVAPTFATGLHQVDNPVFDREGNLYVTYSGTRGQQVPVSIFRVRQTARANPSVPAWRTRRR